MGILFQLKTHPESWADRGVRTSRVLISWSMSIVSRAALRLESSAAGIFDVGSRLFSCPVSASYLYA